MSGFTLAVRGQIRERDVGRCFRCGRPGTQAHHRRPRGMGGSRVESTNAVSNGIWVCDGCHAWIESNRIDAKALGYLVDGEAEPVKTPVWHYLWGLVLLDDDGFMNAVDPSRFPFANPPGRVRNGTE